MLYRYFRHSFLTKSDGKYDSKVDCRGLPRNIPSLILELIHQYWGAAEPDPVSLINNSLIPCQDSYKIKYQTVRTHGGRDQRAGILLGEELHEHESRAELLPRL